VPPVGVFQRPGSFAGVSFETDVQIAGDPARLPKRAFSHECNARSKITHSSGVQQYQNVPESISLLMTSIKLT